MVFKSFPVDTKDKKVTIDLVSDDGLRWIKLRMCSSFEHKIEFEESDSSSDSEVDEVEGIAPIVKQALGLKRAAFLNQFHFKEPEIEYKFLSMQSKDFPPVVLNSLTAIGIKVSFGLNENTKLDGYHYLTNTVNLDVTTLIAMVSDISHRFATIPAEAFDSKPLVMQRAMEANSQILPALSKIFKGRKLVCCLAAFEKFREIVSTIGGPFEQSRAKYLFPDKDLGIRTDLVRNEVESLGWSIEVVPNKVPANFGTKTLIDLNTNIFGTGNAMKISTISSNQGFKRSLEHAGGSESILIHEPRGLIEQKWLKVSSATPSSIHNGGIH